MLFRSGYLIGLRRTNIGNFSIENALDIEKIEKTKDEDRVKFLLLPEELLGKYEKIILSFHEENAIKDGKIIEQKTNIPGLYRLYGVNNNFIGLGEIDETKNLKAKRLKSLIN